MDFLQRDQSFHTSSKYEPIYIHFNQEYKVGYKDLFLVCASLGAKEGNRSEADKGGREFRSSFFSEKEKKLAYTIIINDEKVGKNLDSFNSPDFPKEARKLLEEYAEGGMDVLVEKVFKDKWNGHKLDSNYDNYAVDMMQFVLATIKDVPF